MVRYLSLASFHGFTAHMLTITTNVQWHQSGRHNIVVALSEVQNPPLRFFSKAAIMSLLHSLVPRYRCMGKSQGMGLIVYYHYCLFAWLSST